MDKPDRTKDKQVLEGKIFAILAYLSILCIIPLVFKKDNPFALFHGKQGLVLFIGQVAVFILTVIPIFEWMFRPLIFVLLVFSFAGMIQALKGEYFRMPVVSEIADKITL